MFSFDWLQNVWESLLDRAKKGNLPHAIVLAGPRDVGKNQFAQELSMALLCQQPHDSGSGCGTCQDCRLFQVGNHPDYFSILPEEESKGIKIDQIRELCAKLTLKSQFGGYRIAVINPADRMNTAAANALLKTLEEPGDDTLIILVTSQPGFLPATIRSRCQIVNCPTPTLDQARKWLATQGVTENIDQWISLTHGAPLAIPALSQSDALEQRLQLFKDMESLFQGQKEVTLTAQSWLKYDIHRCIEWLISWVMDMIKAQYPVEVATFANPDLIRRLHRISHDVDLTDLFNYLDKLQEANKLADTSVNDQLLLESLFMSWAKFFRNV